MVAVNLPRAKICHRAVVADVSAFEAVGVNEVRGQPVRAGKGRNAEFDRRGREIGVLREDRVKQRSGDRQLFHFERIEQDPKESVRNNTLNCQPGRRTRGGKHRRCGLPHRT